MDKKKDISMAVIKRLPKYYRHLAELLRNDVDRISSKELSEKIGFTASQIRQDFNCFGGFGQQRGPRRTKGSDLRIRVRLNYEEMMNGPT